MGAYNYNLGQKLIEEFYPDDAWHGGIISCVYCGELHALMAKYHEGVINDNTTLV